MVSDQNPKKRVRTQWRLCARMHARVGGRDPAKFTRIDMGARRHAQTQLCTQIANAMWRAPQHRWAGWWWRPRRAMRKHSYIR